MTSCKAVSRMNNIMVYYFRIYEGQPSLIDLAAPVILLVTVLRARASFASQLWLRSCPGILLCCKIGNSAE